MTEKDSKTPKNKSAISLTNDYVAKLQPKEKMYDVRDATLVGFYVRVQPSGVKSYRCQYKRGKHYTIGRVEKFKVPDARAQAKIIMGDAEKGFDPNEAKRQGRIKDREKIDGFTFNEFLEEKYKPWYKAAYPKTWKGTFKVLDVNFKAVFGNLLLQEITIEKVEAWRAKQQLEKTRVRVRKDENGQKAKVTEPVTPSTLNRYIERLSGVLGKAAEYKCIPSNPLMVFALVHLVVFSGISM